MRHLIPTVLAVLFAGPGECGAQQLRRAVEVADLVVVARPIGVRPLGEDLFLHRFATQRALKGDAPAAFSLVEHERLAEARPPAPGSRRARAALH